MEKILVVEDDAALSRGLEYALTKEGFDVATAFDLKKANELFKSGNFQLILLDVMLPDGNGYDFCKQIRVTSTVPIIFLTACDEEVNIVLGLDIGGDDYITKPFRVRELISRIKVALRRSVSTSSDASTTLRSGDINVYPLQASVKKGTAELNLTPAEYKLLVALMQNTGQILTREIILEKLWDVAGEFVDDNTLSVYIRRLREKLEDDPSEPKYILTVRGLGYKWNIRST